MVKVGFIVEGETEKIIIESEMFKTFLTRYNYELILPVINAKGGGNLLPEHIEPFIERLKQQNVDIIVVLTDSEDEPNVEEVRNRIQHNDIKFIFVAVKAIEAWFLADTQAMNNFLKHDTFLEENPEQTQYKPFDRIKEIINQLKARGVGSKLILAKNMIKHWGFSIERASEHPNCPSVKEFVDYFRKSLPKT